MFYIYFFVDCDENLKQLENETNRFGSNLEKLKELDIFPDECLEEIIEPYDEEKEAEWRSTLFLFACEN